MEDVGKFLGSPKKYEIHTAAQLYLSVQVKIDFVLTVNDASKLNDILIFSTSDSQKLEIWQKMQNLAKFGLFPLSKPIRLPGEEWKEAQEWKETKFGLFCHSASHQKSCD